MAQFGQTQQKEDTSNLTEAQQIELNYEKLKSIVENPKESKFGSNILFNKQQYEQAKALLPEYERYFSEKKAYEEEKRKYEQKQEEASRYAEGYNLFFDDLKYGMHGRYLAGHNESFVKGYLDARKYLAKEQARYGSAETVAKYGTQAEKARFFNLPEGATNFVYNKDGSFSYDTSEGKISIIPNKVNIPTPSNPQNVEVVGYNTIVESGGIKTFFDNKGNVKGYETSGFPYGEQSIMVRQPEMSISVKKTPAEVTTYKPEPDLIVRKTPLTEVPAIRQYFETTVKGFPQPTQRGIELGEKIKKSSVGQFSIEVASLIKEMTASVGRGMAGVISAYEPPSVSLAVASLPEEEEIEFRKEQQKRQDEINSLVSKQDYLNLALAGGFLILQLTPAGPLIDYYFMGTGAVKTGKVLFEGRLPTPKEAAEIFLYEIPLLTKGAKAVSNRVILTKEAPFIDILKKEKIAEETIPSVFFGDTLGRIRGARILPRIIDDVTGKELGYLLTKFKGKGIYGSIGGAIEKGEKPVKAAIREALEETGKKIKQEELKLLTKQGTPEGIDYLYTMDMKKSEIANLKAKSDITEFEVISAERIKEVSNRWDISEQPRFIRTSPFAQLIYKLIPEWDYGPKVRNVEVNVLKNVKELEKINRDIEKLTPEARKIEALRAKEELTKEFGDKISLKFYKEADLIRDLRLKEQGLLPKIAKIETTKGTIYLLSASAYDYSPKALEPLFDKKTKRWIYEKSTKQFKEKTLTISGEEQLNLELLKISKRIGEKEYRKRLLYASGSIGKSFLTEEGTLRVLTQKELNAMDIKTRGENVMFFTPPPVEKNVGLTSLDYTLGFGEKERVITLLPKWAKPEIRFGRLPAISKEVFESFRKLKEKGYSYEQLAQAIQELGLPNELIPTAKAYFGIEREFGALGGTEFKQQITGRIVLEGKSIKLRELTQEKRFSPEKEAKLNVEDYKPKKEYDIKEDLKKAKSDEEKILEDIKIIKDIKTPKEYVSILEKSKIYPTKENIKEAVKESKKVEPFKILEKDRLPEEYTKEREKPIKINEFPIKEREKLIYRSFELIEYPPEEPPIEPPTKRPPEYPVEKPPRFPFDNETKTRYGSSQKGYNVYAKGVSLGKNKKESLVKINTQPVTKAEAFDIGAYATDTSLSRKFLIKPTKQQAEPSNLSFPRGYFEANIEKFRSFKVKQGKKQALQDEFIEKSGFALDTSGERKKITIAKKIAEIRKSGRTPIDSDINFAINLID
jgi:8-oxo-dGTP pyrophosphatase MutT (NUDIX family)